MEKLTKRQALEHAIALWKWLERHPAQPKSAYPETGDWDSYCPCCQYVCDHSGERANCEWGPDHQAPITRKQLAMCPLVGLWPSGCLDRKSPYRLWIGNGDLRASVLGDRRKFARQIWEAAQAELEKLAT
jgi:hypothetical protein